MGAYTAQEMNNLLNSAIDYHVREKAKSQIDQDRPLYDALMANKESFPGGKEYITRAVKGQYSSSMTGYSHDDDVNFVNPANVKRAKAKWYELGSGIKVTYTELKTQGIHIVSSNGEKISRSADTDFITLTPLLEEKLDDLLEGSKRSVAEIFWRDGTQDALAPPGIMSFILDSPASGSTFGLDRAALSWWRNRASLNINVSTPSNLNLINTLQSEFRQLRRYVKPKHKIFAGSDAISALEAEMRSKGFFTQDGWANGKQDPSIADFQFKKVDVVYDPLLDDLGKSKYLYVLDLNAIKWRPMDQEEWVTHNPERPPEKYVFYRAMTLTGAIMANCLNSSGVYSIA